MISEMQVLQTSTAKIASELEQGQLSSVQTTKQEDFLPLILRNDDSGKGTRFSEVSTCTEEGDEEDNSQIDQNENSEEDIDNKQMQGIASISTLLEPVKAIVQLTNELSSPLLIGESPSMDVKNNPSKEPLDNQSFNLTAIKQTSKSDTIAFNKSTGIQILLIGKLNDDECFPIFAKLIQQFKGRACRFLFETHSIEKIKGQFSVTGNECDSEQILLAIQEFIPAEHEMLVDLIITLGGDGTILYSMSHFQHRPSPPIIAIEKGTLGYMCMYQIENIENDFKVILASIENNGCLKAERKMRVHAVIKDSTGNIAMQNGVLKQFHALNEIVIDRSRQSSCLKLDISLNNEELTQTVGDGLIFSTPTGSTAYSLSAGGPIIQNEVRSISLVPICPFSLSFRPIVLPECSKLKVKLAKDNRGKGFITGDGQCSFEILPGEELVIEQSDIDVYVVREANKKDNVHEWISKIRKMLNWNSNFSK